MAMTKKEQAELDDLKRQLVEARALRFSNAQPPTPIPPPSNGRVNGWDYHAHDLGRVFPAWSESYSHGQGHWKDGRRDPCGSQGGKPLYASRLDALVALRLAKETECAKVLSRIDEQIEVERASNSSAEKE